jgi:multiple sugar transport system permease protein
MEANPVQPPVSRRQAAGRFSVRRAQSVLFSAVMILVGLLWLAPTLWALVTSLKVNENLFTTVPNWIPWPITLDHYAEVFRSTRGTSIGTALVNSTIVSVLSVLLTVFVSALAAYPLARMEFPGRNVVFVCLVGSLMVPGIISVVPLYLVMHSLRWLNSYQALILPGVASAFGVFMLRQFFMTLPVELEDAARIDGANSWLIFARILMPLSQPALVALSIFTFEGTWNDYAWPLIVMTKQTMMTLPIALAGLRSDYTSAFYGKITAGAVVSAIPLLIVFIVANRRIVEGIQFSGLKS